MTNFMKNETGAVTVDWVVLTAGLVGLGLATMSVVSTGVQDTAGDIDSQLERNHIMRTSFSSAALAVGQGQMFMSPGAPPSCTGGGMDAPVQVGGGDSDDGAGGGDVICTSWSGSSQEFYMNDGTTWQMNVSTNTTSVNGVNTHDSTTTWYNGDGEIVPESEYPEVPEDLSFYNQHPATEGEGEG